MFLDEPTSGLDSGTLTGHNLIFNLLVAAFSVIETVKNLAFKKHATVMATIHQPSTETFELFTHVLILAKGETVFFGRREDAIGHFESIGNPIPLHSNPSDYFLRITNMDFLQGAEQLEGQRMVSHLIEAYKSSPFSSTVEKDLENCQVQKTDLSLKTEYSSKNSFLYQTKTLMSRAFKNASKNPLLYWVRVAMYVGLALLMGTVKITC